jgi:Holliday junction resolvase
MNVNSRNKGATFERDIARELNLLTGVSFKRDIEQYRAADRGDLIADDDAWPFTVECKRYRAGDGCKDAWIAQAVKAAKAAGKLPCVVFKFDRKPIRCAVPFEAIAAALDAKSDSAEWAHISLEGLAYLAREIMAWRK